MSLSFDTLAVANKFTRDSLAGAGAVAGVPCQIQSKTAITGGTRVIFLWVDNNGDSHTTTMDVMNGVDGQDGKGIQSVAVNAENHLIITYSDGTTSDAGEIEIHSAVDSVNGKTGAVVLDAEAVGALPANTPIPSKTSNLTNDSGFITKAVNDLVNYYLKSETYSKTQVDDIITAVKNSRFEVVATLPTTNIKTNVIYLVPKSPSQTSNVKDEYINLDGTTSGWEKIGDTEIDLSGYVTTEALNTALAAYTTTADLTTLLAAKQDTLTFDNAPTENSNNPVKSGGIYSSIKTVKDALDDEVEARSVLGAKNLLDLNLTTPVELNGLTFTKNSDGSITVSGIATANTEKNIITFTAENSVYEGSYILSGCPSGGGSNSYVLATSIKTKTPDTFVRNDVDNGNGVSTTITSAQYLQRVFIYINNGMDLTTPITFYPMLRLATDTDPTYQPYTKTNQELTAENEALTNNVDVLFETGVKNICPPYLGSLSANGITYVGNSDGTVTVNGTCSANVGANIRVYLKAGQYKVSGCPSGGSYSTYRIGVTTDSWSLIGTHDHGNGTTITIPSDGYYRINLDIRAGYVANNLVFKPMITDVDTPESDYDHYVPYAKTNRQLTEDSVDWDDMSKLGAVNLLKNEQYTRKDNNVQFTLNADGSVTLSTDGTGATGNCDWILNTDYYIPEGNYILTSGAALPSGIYLGLRISSGWKDITNGTSKIDVPIASGDYIRTTHIYVAMGTVITTPITIKPMLAPVDYNGDYVPYAKTNRELTEETDVTLTPDTSNFSIVSYKIKKRDGHVYGYIDAKVVNVSGVSVGTLSEKPTYTWAQAACNSTHRAADNTPTICYVNNQGVIAINPANVFVVDDRIQIAIDFYTSL